MLSVVFGRTTPAYRPGELLTGDVVITTTTQASILDLTVNYCGMSLVSFIFSEGKGKTRTCDKVEETDIHLDVLHPLVKSYRGVLIEAGIHTYPFSLKLPQLLPASYQSVYGHVSYYIHVHLQTKACMLDARRSFVIRAPVNINLFISSQNPQCAEVVKKYGLVGNKLLQLKASVSKTCFVPGDIIPVLVEFNNETCHQVHYLFCTLKQITNVLVHLQERTVNRETKQCLVTVAHKQRENKACCKWLCHLPSPPNLTPTLSASTIVFVTYVIQVSAKLKRVPVPPEVQIPVIFGIRAPVFTQQQYNTISRTRSVSQQCHPCARRQVRRSSSTTLLPSVVDNQSLPNVTSPRRRVTVTSQPQLSTPSPTRRISSQLQSVTSNLTQPLSSQLQLSFSSIKQFTT